MVLHVSPVATHKGILYPALNHFNEYLIRTARPSMILNVPKISPLTLLRCLYTHVGNKILPKKVGTERISYGFQMRFLFTTRHMPFSGYTPIIPPDRCLSLRAWDRIEALNELSHVHISSCVARYPPLPGLARNERGSRSSFVRSTFNMLTLAENGARDWKSPLLTEGN